MKQMKILNDYKLIKCMGEGSFGKVYLTKKDNDPKIYATKILEIAKTKNDTMKKYLSNEIKIMKMLTDDDNIIHLYDLLMTTNHYYFIMEYCNGGTLSQLLKDYKLQFGKPFSQEIIQHFMRQIVKGLKYIHSKNIIHRDMKLDNILVNFENLEDKNNFNLLSAKIKIIDFGLATKDKGKTVVGSPLYMDPRILEKYNKAGGFAKLQEYDEKADIWSLGSICYEMLTGESLFNVNTLPQLIEKVEKGDYTIPLYSHPSKEIISFINSMLQYDPDKRLSSEYLFIHPFLKKDVKDFSKANLDKLSYKINNGLLTINIKENKTICLFFQEDEKNKNEYRSRNNCRNIKDYETIQTYHLSSGKQVKKYFKNPSPSPNKRNSEGVIKIYKNIQIETSPKKHNLFIEGVGSPMRNRKIKNNDLENIENEEKEMENIKKSNLIFEEQEKEKEQIGKMIKKEENQKYINALLNEYMAAKEYFKNNNLKKQEQDANNKILEIQNIKSQNELGYSIYLNNLPEPITKEYIYGYSTSERNNKFKMIINKYISDKNRLLSKMESYQKYIISKKFKEEYQKDKKKLEELNSIIYNLKKRYENEWAPAPEFTKISKQDKVEKTSYDNCEFKVVVEMKINQQIKKDINFVLTLLLNEKKKLIRNTQLNKNGNYSNECIWSINSFDWNNIDNNGDNFLLYIVNEKNSNIPFKYKINIGCVQRRQGINFNIKIPIEDNDSIKIHFNVFPIIPKGKKYLGNENRIFFILKKILPPFEGKSLVTSNQQKLS